MTVQWSQIVAECDGYRAGFVAVFRQYEGQPTDERDGAGRIVKVTVNSFAAHVGIHSETFRRWTKMSTSAVPISRTRKQYIGDVTRATRHEPEAVIEAIMQAPDKVRDEIIRETLLRRDGVDRTPAGRKAGQAAGHALSAPFRKFAAKLRGTIIADQIDDARQALDDAISEEVLSVGELDQIIAAHTAFGESLDVARFALITNNMEGTS